MRQRTSSNKNNRRNNNILLQKTYNRSTRAKKVTNNGRYKTNVPNKRKNIQRKETKTRTNPRSKHKNTTKTGSFRIFKHRRNEILQQTTKKSSNKTIQENKMPSINFSVYFTDEQYSKYIQKREKIRRLILEKANNIVKEECR